MDQTSETPQEPGLKIKSKSFSRVPPRKKMQKARSFTEALRDKYCASEDTECDFIVQIVFRGRPKNNGQTTAELAHLRNVVLSNSRVSIGGLPESGLPSLCPNVTDLDLSSNLLESWAELLPLLSQLQHLKFLNLSRNHLTRHKEELWKWSTPLPKVENLVLNSTGVPLREVLALARLMPALKELHICCNYYQDLGSVELAIEDGALSKLECLRLNENIITSWAEVWKLRNLPCLTQLILSENPLCDLFYCADWPRDLDLGEMMDSPDITCHSDNEDSSFGSPHFKYPVSRMTHQGTAEDQHTSTSPKNISRTTSARLQASGSPKTRRQLNFDVMEHAGNQTEDISSAENKASQQVSFDGTKHAGNQTEGLSSAENKASPQVSFGCTEQVHSLPEGVSSCNSQQNPTNSPVQISDTRSDNQEQKYPSSPRQISNASCEQSASSQRNITLSENLEQNPASSPMQISDPDSENRDKKSASSPRDISGASRNDSQQLCQAQPASSSVNQDCLVTGLIDDIITNVCLQTNVENGNERKVDEEEGEGGGWGEEGEGDAHPHFYLDDEDFETGCHGDAEEHAGEEERRDESSIPFKTLHTLCLSRTSLCDTEHLQALNEFPALHSLRIMDIALFSELDKEERRKLFVASLPKVKFLNGSEVSVTERDKSERHYLRHFLEKPDRPSRYEQLENKHGPIQPLFDIDLGAKFQTHATLTFLLCGVEQFRDSVSLLQPVGKLRSYVSGRMNIPRRALRMFHNACGPNQDPVNQSFDELFLDSLPLSRFDFMDGDEIHVDFSTEEAVVPNLTKVNYMSFRN